MNAEKIKTGSQQKTKSKMCITDEGLIQRPIGMGAGEERTLRGILFVLVCVPGSRSVPFPGRRARNRCRSLSSAEGAGQ